MPTSFVSLASYTLYKCAELETHLHISDKAVGEFIIDTARSQKDVDEFKAVRVCVCLRAGFARKSKRYIQCFSIHHG